MIHERFAERFEDWLGLIRDHHTVHGSIGAGPDHVVEPARRLRRRPRGGDLLPPDAGRRRDGRRRHLFDRDVRADRRRRRASRRSTRRWSWPTATATACPPRSTRRRARTPSASASGSRRAWCRSTTRPRAPRRTCRSAATASPATARASPGIWVLDQFTRWQSMNWDYAGKLQKAQMDLVELPGRPGVPPVLMLLAEELLLLLLDDEKGKASSMRHGAPTPAWPARCCWTSPTAGRLVEVDGGSWPPPGRRRPSPRSPPPGARSTSRRRPSTGCRSCPDAFKPIKGTHRRGAGRARRARRAAPQAARPVLLDRFPSSIPALSRSCGARLRACSVDGAEPDARTRALLGLLVLARPRRSAWSRATSASRRAARAKALAERGRSATPFRPRSRSRSWRR